VNTNDTLTIIISLLALIVSIIALIRGSDEQRRTILNQLSEGLDKINNLIIEHTKLQFEYAAKDMDYFRNVISPAFSEEIGTLLDQVMYLANQKSIQGLVAPSLLGTIAIVNANLGQVGLAEKYHEKAIQASGNDNYAKVNSLRASAEFLMMGKQDFVEGRKRFEAAVALLKDTDNITRIRRSFVYATWGWYEKNVAKLPQKAAEAFTNAENDLQGITTEFVRTQALESLKYIQEAKTPPSTTKQAAQSLRAPSTSLVL